MQHTELSDAKNIIANAASMQILNRSYFLPAISVFPRFQKFILSHSVFIDLELYHESQVLRDGTISVTTELKVQENLFSSAICSHCICIALQEELKNT